MDALQSLVAKFAQRRPELKPRLHPKSERLNQWSARHAQRRPELKPRLHSLDVTRLGPLPQTLNEGRS